METPFQLNLSKLTLDGLRAQQEHQAQLARDLEQEIARRRDEALTEIVDEMWAKARGLGFSDKQIMAALSPKVKKAFARATAEPAAAPAGEGPKDKPQVGETYANPNDPSQTWTKTTRLGAPARWLHALVVASEAKTYEQFRVVK
jgi:DNA-binding protein H-NS